MDRRRRILLNAGEVATDATLSETVDRHDARVHQKLRVASALRIDGSGISDKEFEYALRAEFDFVVVDGESKPLFAVEFDERHHLTDPQTIERDALKGSICEQLGLPLLRVTADYLKQWRQRQSVLSWLVESYFLERAFHEAQDAGEVAPDEPYCYWSVIGFSLGDPARDAMVRAWADGLAPRNGPEHVSMNLIFTKPPGAVESYCLFELEERRFVVGHAGLRWFNPFGGVMAPDLVGDLATADCGRKLELYRAGKYVPASAELLTAVRDETYGWVRNGQMCSDLPDESANGGDGSL